MRARTQADLSTEMKAAQLIHEENLPMDGSADAAYRGQPLKVSELSQAFYGFFV